MLTYYTHDNGGRPFKVVIREISELGDKTVEVYKLWNKKEDIVFKGDDEYHNFPCYNCYMPLRVMIGESPKNKMTEYSGGYGPEFSGNSILIHENNDYVWIGERIIRFRPEVRIEEFVSPVGNNDVPYSWARDALGNTYLFVLDVILGPDCQWEKDPYGYYLKHSLITTDLGLVPPVKPLLKFRGVTGFRVGNEDYTLRHHSDAGADYDRLMGWNEGKIIFKFGNVEKTMTRDEYIEFMDAFGQLKHFRPFNYSTIQPRLW